MESFVTWRACGIAVVRADLAGPSRPQGVPEASTVRNGRLVRSDLAA